MEVEKQEPFRKVRRGLSRIRRAFFIHGCPSFIVRLLFKWW